MRPVFRQVSSQHSRHAQVLPVLHKRLQADLQQALRRDPHAGGQDEHGPREVDRGGGRGESARQGAGRQGEAVGNKIK